MKIVLLTSSLSSGGAERVASTLCNSWSSRGDHVTLIPTFSGGGQPFYRLFESVDLLYLANQVRGRGGNIRRYAERLSTLRRLIVERKPDVVIAFLPNVNVAAILATAGTGIPLIICERSDPSQQPYTRFWKTACQLTYRFADMLTVQTNAVAKSALGIFPGLKKVRAVPNPLSPDILNYVRKPKQGRKILLSLGRLSEEKQIDKIIAAFAAVHRDLPDWDLHVYGDGPLREELEQTVVQAGLQERIFMKGATTEPWKTMAGANAFVMTSRYEGFPNALMEAMAVGLPCIAFDCPSGPREISNDGRDALLVELNNHDGLSSAMKRLMGDDALQATLGDGARTAVLERFGMKAVLDRWDDLFKEVGVG